MVRMTKRLINIKFQRSIMAVKKNSSLSSNPWLAVWTKPRETIQEILTFNPQYLVILLASLYGLKQSADLSAIYGFGDVYPLWGILIGILILGPVIGVLSLYFGSWLLVWTGRWLQGQSSFQSMRAAIAWSYVPILGSLLLFLVSLPFLGKELFTLEQTIDASTISQVWLIIVSALDILLGIWSFVLSLIMISEVQQFSVWKALGNIVLTMLVVLVPLFIIFTTYFFIVLG